MGYYTSNCPISGPITISAPADVDLGGFQWSYRAGLMFAPQAESQMSTIRPPKPSIKLNPHLSSQ